MYARNTGTATLTIYTDTVEGAGLARTACVYRTLRRRVPF